VRREESDIEKLDSFDNQTNQEGSGLSGPSFLDLDPIDINVDQDKSNHARVFESHIQSS
jgi:hypothetical protein